MVLVSAKPMLKLYFGTWYLVSSINMKNQAAVLTVPESEVLVLPKANAVFVPNVPGIGYLGEARQVVLEAVEPHGAIVRSKRPFSHCTHHNIQHRTRRFRGDRAWGGQRAPGLGKVSQSRSGRG